MTAPTDSIPVAWSLEDSPAYTGLLELVEDGLRLIGTTPEGDEGTCRVDAADVVHVTAPAVEADRVAGLETVMIRDAAGRRLRLAALTGSGPGTNVVSLFRAVESAIATPGATRVAVRVPIHPEAAGQVRSLVRRGPPFDPDLVPGLTRHDVLVFGHEVVFVFDGASAAQTVERLLKDAHVWSAAEEWNACVAGPPTLIEPEYSWVRAVAARAPV